jgi:pyridoxal phosphate enzyme (YggS family)
MLKENIEAVRKNIEKACEKSGRNPKDVLLLPVSKTKPVEMIQELYDLGIRSFGENYVQELCDKVDKLSDDINWHMIGHLQRNKVKYIVGKVAMIHSVDSIRLAEAISKEAVKKDVTVDILIEVNVGMEENKFGITVESAYEDIKEMAKLPNIAIKGLMTSAPFVENSEDNRKYFRQLKQLSVDIQSKNIDNVDMGILSMGMTNDYIVAIEEGATIVRVGTAIFGARNYNI